MANVGVLEIILILVVLAMFIGGIVLIVLLVSRGKNGRLAALEEENRRLRDELDRQRGNAV